MNIEIRKYYYGDIPDNDGAANSFNNENSTAQDKWPLWEVFHP